MHYWKRPLPTPPDPVKAGTSLALKHLTKIFGPRAGGK